MPEDSSQQNKDFGLPKVEYQPIDRGQPGIAKEVPVVKTEPEKKDNRLLIIALSVVGILVLASLFYMIFWDDDSSDSIQDTPAVQDRSVIEADESAESDTSHDLDDAAESAGNVDEDLLASEEPGSITTISQRTNRYYIFVGSYKFRAYAQRHAEKLAADGFAVKLITPDNWVGMRVAVGTYGNKDEASADARQLRSRYGNEVVISKY